MTPAPRPALLSRHASGRGAALRARLRRTTAVDGPPQWVSGVLAGVQAALLSLLAVVVPGLVAYVTTSADPSNADVGWTQAVAVAAGLWLLGHGGMLRAGDVLVTLVPLGIALLGFLVAYASARRSAHPTRSAWAAATVSYAALVLVVVLATGSAGPLGAGPLAVLRVLAGSALVAGLGAGLGTGRLLPALRSWRARLPAWADVGLVGAGVASAAVVAAAGAVTAWWVVAGRAATGDVLTGLAPDAVGGVVLGLGQLTLLPNLLLWAAAWLTGAGFTVGAGTAYAPAEVVSAPLPALPLLGALPTSPVAPWLPPLAVVAAGVLAGWYVHRALRPRRAWETVAAAGTAAGATGLTVLVLQVVAGGAAGPGRMAVVGAEPWATAGLATALVVAGAVLVAVPADRLVRALAARLVRRARSAVRGSAGAGRRERSASQDALDDAVDA